MKIEILNPKNKKSSKLSMDFGQKKKKPFSALIIEDDYGKLRV